jgi:hypothetical protein
MTRSYVGRKGPKWAIFAVREHSLNRSAARFDRPACILRERTCRVNALLTMFRQISFCEILTKLTALL